MEVISQREWSNLLPELIRFIAGKLSSIDRLSCRYVCSHWNQAIEYTPWLIFNDRPLREKDDNTLRFLSMADGNRLFKLPLPPSMETFVGSSHGWLITINRHGDMYLVNPISDDQIPLPSISNLPFIPDNAKNDTNFQTAKFSVTVQGAIETTKAILVKGCDFHHLLDKAVLSAPPVLAEDGSWKFTVMMIFSKQLYFAKSGDNSWSEVHGSCRICDIIMHSNKLFYTINQDYLVEVLEPCGNTFKSRSVSPQFPAKHFPEFIPPAGQYSTPYPNRPFSDLYLYLAETTCGELMAVLINWSLKEGRLFSWDKEGRWKRQKSLGGQALFLGCNHSMCVQASTCPELSPDTIYYIFKRLGHMRPMFVDNEGARQVKILQQTRLAHHKRCFPPIWFSPSMKEVKVVRPQELRANEVLEHSGFRWKTHEVNPRES